MRQGHWRACTDVYCLATPKEKPPRWIWMAAIRQLDSSAGQLGFRQQPLLAFGGLDREDGDINCLAMHELGTGCLEV